MRCDFGRSVTVAITFVASVLLSPPFVRAQNAGQAVPSPSAAENAPDLKTLGDLIRQLQSQVQDLSLQVKTLQANEQQARAEAQDLRGELEKAKIQLASLTGAANGTSVAAAPSSPASDQTSSEDRIARLEEDLQLANSKIAEQSQTKVESGSKYRLRLNGIVLLNLFANRGTVDSQDVPQIATAQGLLGSSGTFGGSLRQSQIGLQAFGPEIAGARTSADIKFDFAGGFPQVPNGVETGIVRLRTGTIRFDWTNTSIIAGQDYLFFSPLSPTSMASLAIPALSYSGNLWGWTPQVRVEHRFHVSEASTILVQGGILDSLSGDIPEGGYSRSSTWGEESGQPAYAARVAWSHRAFGQNIVAGVGGYYGRESWGFGRSVDAWAGTADLTVPLGQYVEFSGQFYRGRAVGGLGGGIGQSVFWNGPLTDPATEVYGLNSMGGWVQLKIKPTAKFEINGAIGDDSPFSSDLREFSANPNYLGSLLSKNISPFVNFIYRPRSPLVFSLEYRRLKTYTLDSNANAANLINLSVGYIF